MPPAHLNPPLPRLRRCLAAGRPVHLVFLGDSISEVGRSPNWHGGASAPEHNWGALLQDRLADEFPTVDFRRTHLGIGGQNSYEGLGRLDSLAGLAPDLVCVSFGTNDCCHHEIPPAATGRALLELLTQVPERFAADAVMVGTGGENPLLPRFLHVAETIAASRRAATDAGAPFVDLRAAILGATRHGPSWGDFHLEPNNCHPNNAGHRVWANTVAAVLLGCLAAP